MAHLFGHRPRGGPIAAIDIIRSRPAGYYDDDIRRVRNSDPTQRAIRKLEREGGIGGVAKKAAKKKAKGLVGAARTAAKAIKDDPVGVAWDVVNPMNTVRAIVDAEGGYQKAKRSGDFGGSVNAAAGLAGELAMSVGSPKRGMMGRKIRAYHGSPHDFDRFDLSKIGTGEGAQAYGHGLYFAENPHVADAYAAMNGSYINGRPVSVEEAYPINALRDANFDYDAAIADTKEMAATRPEYNRYIKTLEAWKEWQPQIDHAGKRYEVNINADPDSLLDWDAPLKGQNPIVRDTLGERLAQLQADGQVMMPQYMRQFDEGTLTGSQAYQGIGGNSFADLTDKWKAKGVPGIKYLDQMSRAKDAGTRNFVIFDDEIIDILRKY